MVTRTQCRLHKWFERKNKIDWDKIGINQTKIWLLSTCDWGYGDNPWENPKRCFKTICLNNVDSFQSKAFIKSKQTWKYLKRSMAEGIQLYEAIFRTWSKSWSTSTSDINWRLQKTWSFHYWFLKVRFWTLQSFLEELKLKSWLHWAIEWWT